MIRRKEESEKAVSSRWDPQRSLLFYHKPKNREFLLYSHGHHKYLSSLQGLHNDGYIDNIEQNGSQASDKT
jgi:hypothetical protein